LGKAAGGHKTENGTEKRYLAESSTKGLHADLFSMGEGSSPFQLCCVWKIADVV
jgi:hypothetical protein